MSDFDDDDELSEAGEPEEIPDALDKPVVKISQVVTIDAKQNLGDGRKFAVKSNASGIRLSYTKRVKEPYYSNGYRSQTDGLTLPNAVFDEIYDILTQVKEARDSE